MYQQILSRLALSLQNPLPEPRRLFHGRGHMFEGLEHVNIDFFPPVLLLTGYKPIDELQELIDGTYARLSSLTSKHRLSPSLVIYQKNC